MEVEDAGLPVDSVHASQLPTRCGVGQQAEIAAAAGRQIFLHEAHRRDRHFQQAILAIRVKSETRCIRHAVMVMRNRVNAGTVAVAGLQQRVQRPQVAAADGKTWRTIAQHLLAADIFQQRFTARNVIQEFFSALIGSPQMRVTVAGEFMATVDNAFDHCRVALRDPAQSEEGALDLPLIHQRENAIDVCLHTARQ